ncbi:MAG: chemotaxis protein CheC [Candidatus Altiarchaeota archaeon]|nr:chemotaxis protein CheC [Candidatus Altiarchaeota archaeon]
MKFKNLTPLELDALMEISSIGAGHASIALSSLTDKKIEVSFPWMEVCPLETVTSKMGRPEKEITNIYLHIDGTSLDNQFEVCSLLLVLPVKDAATLAKILQGEEATGAEELSDMDRSTLMEIGNILAGSYLSAIAEYLNLSLVESLPALAADMLDSVMDPIIAQHACDVENALLFNTRFLVEGLEITGHFVVLFYSHMGVLIKNVRYLLEMEEKKDD